ncbi:hypothetical protein C1I99_07590 [Micromonospora deserti]|uniref:Uncharacterized protein n=1 Tax=Micromonospora deserti TaxID=2070366 RepID=A0A2W2DNM9_9ACTN|nr:hypothetical protein C1I99_07590 [Micromonospora deserti]
MLPGTASAAPAAPQAAAAVLDDVTGAYYPVSPARLMDTRNGTGGRTGALGAGQKFDLQVSGRGGIPSTGVGAVVLNVTVTGPTMNSYLTAYPAGEARPTASSINFPKGWLGSNSVTVKLGSGGKVSIYNHLGSTHVVVDVVGFYAVDNSLTDRAGNQYQPYLPTRLWDTRNDGTGKMPAGSWIDYSLDFDEYNSNVKTVIVNLTAVSPAKSGFLTAWSGVGSRPTASTVNYLVAKNVPNLAYIKTTPCLGTGDDWWCTAGAPKWRVYTSQSAHIVTDLVGVMDDGAMEYGLRFKPMSPTRIVDTRIGQGASVFGPGSVRTITPPAEMVSEDTGVLALNVTAVAPSNNTVITLWPAGYDLPKPESSNLNPYAGVTVSGGALTPVGPDGSFNMHNLSGTTHMVTDVVGTFYYPAPVAGTSVPTAKAGSVRPEATGSHSPVSTGK